MWTTNNWYEAAHRAAALNGERVRKMADHLLTIYQAAMPDRNREGIVEALQESNRERLSAAPDLQRYPELRGMRELVEAQWRGTREGAGLTDAQWAVNCNGLFYYHRHLRSGSRSAGGCSYVFFPTSDHGPILANNLDSTPAEPFGPPDWPAINEHLLMGGVSSGIFYDETSPEIFPAPIFKLVGRYCRSTAEGVKMLKRYNHFWGPGNLILIDRNRKVAMVEKSACRIGVRWSPDGFGHITAMTAEEPQMNAYLKDRRAHSIQARNLPAECDDTIYWRGADSRRELMNELLEEARKNPTLDKLRRIIQFRDPERGRVCYDGEPLYPGGPPVEHTIRTTIWLLEEGRAMWWAKEGDTPSFENRKEDVCYEDVLLWN